MLSAAIAPRAANADGDPASDVLATQALFLPAGSGIPQSRQATLAALLQQLAQHHHPLRVAIIASPTDLGSITALWHQPQNYARFLGQELSLAYHGTVLVVMPNGYGLDKTTSPAGPRSSPVANLRPQHDLGAAATAAVQRIAAASGVTLSQSAIHAAAPPSASDTLSWIVFVVGGVAIIMAWTLSLRARPPKHWQPPS